MEVLVGAGRVDEARDVLARAVQARPDRAELPLELARLLVEAGRPQEASEWFARAAEADPRPETVSATVRALSELGLRDDAVALLERLREGDRSPDLLVAIGTELQGLGRRDDALRAVDDAVARDGDHAGARVHRGMLLVELERPLDGLASFERVLRRADAGLVEDERSVHVAMAGKGWALSQLGSFEEALQWLNTALQRMPKVDFVSGLLGWVRQNLGRHDEALAAYHAARELDSKFVWYRKGVADCLVLLERPDEARPLFQALLEDSEATSTLGPAERFALHGWCHYRLRDFDAASESLVEALAIDSLLLSCQYDLALVTLLSGGARRGVAEYQ
ncbi:MAG: tetratricopeptide repeat protein, partial [Gaiellaceae bacterium]